MLRKALITAVLIVIALASNGARPAAALSLITQDVRPPQLERSSSDSSAFSGDSGEEFREEFHQTYALSATGRVGLENINGGVQIKVWDRAAVQVDATKKAWRKERLAEARIGEDDRACSEPPGYVRNLYSWQILPLQINCRSPGERLSDQPSQRYAKYAAEQAHGTGFRKKQTAHIPIGCTQRFQHADLAAPLENCHHQRVDDPQRSDG